MKIKELVKSLLINKPSLKDDDNRLTTHIWFRELQKLGIDPHNTPITEFLRKYADNKITVAPTLTRIRRKLQEEDSSYRGKKYYQRKRIRIRKLFVKNNRNRKGFFKMNGNLI